MQKDIPDELDSQDLFRSVFRVAWAVLLSPRLFFRGMKRIGGIKNPFIFLVSCLLVHTIMVAMLQKSPGLMLWILTLGVTFPFVTAGILFFVLTRLFNAPGTFETTFRVNAYASAVSLISWLPLTGIPLEFYRVYLIVIGISSAHSIKASRAFAAVILTLAIYVGALALLAQCAGGLWVNTPSV